MPDLPAPVPIPVTIIGGYLGAGKTTLVNHLLRQREGRRIAVLVNDFGELSIDADLIEAREGDLLRLAGGCVCCSFGSDLMAALLQMRAMQPAPDHILIETSGVALPGAVARTLSLVDGLMLDAVLVLADAESLRERAADRYVGDTVSLQLREADLVVLNKIDLVPAEQMQDLGLWLAEVAPGTRCLSCEHGRLSAALVLGIGMAQERVAPPRSVQTPLALPAATPASELFESLSLQFEHSVHLERLAGALADPALNLLRAKGLMRDSQGRAHSLQQVGSRVVLAASVHPQPLLGRLVCIGPRGALDGQRIRKLVDAAAC
jgi:G3E family GTPase